MKPTEIIRLTTEYTKKQRAYVILHLLRQNRRESESCECEHATLICLKHGTIKGSEKCPKCDTWLGHSPYGDNFDYRDEEDV